MNGQRAAVKGIPPASLIQNSKSCAILLCTETGYVALSLQIRSDFSELSQRGLEVFDDLKLVRCPRSLAPTLVALPSMSLIPFTPFGGDDVGIGEVAAAFEAFVFERENVEIPCSELAIIPKESLSQVFAYASSTSICVESTMQIRNVVFAKSQAFFQYN